MALTIPTRSFGKTDVQVSALGFGGYHLGLVKSRREAIRLTQMAIDAGITFLDNAWEYHDGESEKRMGEALKGRRDRVFLMTKVCTHGRDARVAMRQLEESLRRLRTDYLDLWQVHECVYDSDPGLHYARGGVIEALDLARRQGKVRLVGFTGHKSPSIHLEMLRGGYPFDSCQLPLNTFDSTFRSFERDVLPELLRRGIAPIGMKSLGGTGEPAKKRAIAARDALRYAMSLPVATTVSGIDSERVLKQNLAVARGFRPFTAEQMDAVRRKASQFAADGRFELYKTSATFEGPIGRAMHGYPPVEAMSS